MVPRPASESAAIAAAHTSIDPRYTPAACKALRLPTWSHRTWPGCRPWPRRSEPADERPDPADPAISTTRTRSPPPSTSRPSDDLLRHRRAWAARARSVCGSRPNCAAVHTSHPGTARGADYCKAFADLPRASAVAIAARDWPGRRRSMCMSAFGACLNSLDYSSLPTRYPYTLSSRAAHENCSKSTWPSWASILRRRTITAAGQDGGATLKWIRLRPVDRPASWRAATAPRAWSAPHGIGSAAPDTWRTILGDVELTDPQAPALALNRPGGSVLRNGGGRRRWRHRPRDVVRADRP